MDSIGVIAKFSLFSGGITVLAMVTSEICAWVKGPGSAIIQPVCSPGFIVNHIPFFTLNMSIGFGIIVHAVARVFLDYFAPFCFPAVLVTTIFVTNQEARAHVAQRIRQQIDTFTIGGNNTVHPVVSIALVPFRSLTREAATLPPPTRPAEDTGDSTMEAPLELQELRVGTLTRDASTLPRPRRPSEDTGVSIQCNAMELQPRRVRALTGDALALSTLTSSTLCPVGE